MYAHTELFMFFLLALGIIVLPGLDMALVLASSLGGGRRAGLQAVAGIVSGGFVHVAMGALGLALMLSALPHAFGLMMAAGAAYLAWTGLGLARQGISLAVVNQGSTAHPAERYRRAFRQGMLTNLLNPKAYMFMLAVFPQFVHPERGPVWLQALPMAAIIAVTQVTVYGGITLVAARFQSWVCSRPSWDAAAGRAIGLLLLGIACATAWKAAGLEMGA
jgi:threonine/homoserine/homoserine lactone efflux protein